MLKQIIQHLRTDRPDVPFMALHAIAVRQYNRFTGQSGYSPFFLLYGTGPQDEARPDDFFAAYVRDSTDQEDADWARELALHHEAPMARSAVAGLKGARARTRAYLQEQKGLIRVFGTGDWVLRVWQRTKKHEPFYDVP